MLFFQDGRSYSDRDFHNILIFKYSNMYALKRLYAEVKDSQIASAPAPTGLFLVAQLVKNPPAMREIWV